MMANSDNGGGRTGSAELTLEQTRDWNTKKQQQIINALLEVDPVDEGGVFDVEAVDAYLESEMGEDRPTKQYIYNVNGKFMRAVPAHSGTSWEPPYTVVQVKERDGYGNLRKHILDLLDSATVDNNGSVGIKDLTDKVMNRSKNGRRPTSYIWQTLGEYTAIVPATLAEEYQIESSYGTDKANNEPDKEDASLGVGRESAAVPSPEDEDVDSSSYHRGYADGYRAALRENQD